MEEMGEMRDALRAMGIGVDERPSSISRGLGGSREVMLTQAESGGGGGKTPRVADREQRRRKHRGKARRWWRWWWWLQRWSEVE